MKSVCVVGAGPAGLVAGKTLLEKGGFDVTVYEKSSKIGGIWDLDQNSTEGFLSPNTPTNLSRFTVGFSDLDWNSVNCKTDQLDGLQNGDGARIPMFPKAWMVNRYLVAYRDRYIPHGLIECKREVLEVHRIRDTWRIRTRDADSHEEVREFDYAIMATGFFARPRLLSQTVQGLGCEANQLPVNVIHSSRFRTLEDLIPGEKDLRGKKILMIGGGNSSGETTAAVALQLSDAQWSPKFPRNDRYKDCNIIHVTPRPIYALPHFVEYEEGSRSYVPLDFKLYDLSKRPKELGAYAGRQTKEVKDIVHRAIQTMAGGDQSDLSEALVSRKHEGDDRGTAYVALSESYAEYVRSGLIEAVSGRVVGLQETADGFVSATLQDPNGTSKIDDIAAVIYATGYTPIPALDMLDDATKAAIMYDPTSVRLPVVLEEWQTLSPKVPSISFIGFYEGPYWPVIEMQAKLTAQRWSLGKVTEPHAYEDANELLKLRQDMRDSSLEIPQYWFNDYLGYMEAMADELGMHRNDQGFGSREGCTSPARYVSGNTDHAEADAIMKDLRQLWHDCTLDGRYVPRAAFRALHGHWNIRRTIDSAKATFPSGVLEGTASFHPRVPTLDKTGRSFDLEYLYIESGTFHMSNGHSMTASRRYVYRYSEENGTLTIWFVKPNSDLDVDYLFHNLDFVKPKQARTAGALYATAKHLCVRDMYWTEYELPLEGVALRSFQVKHTVKGPDKDYVADTTYSRPRK